MLVTYTSAVWSQAGRYGNRNSMLARCSSVSGETISEDSSATSRTAASAGFSPGSMWPPSPTQRPVPKPVFL